MSIKTEVMKASKQRNNCFVYGLSAAVLALSFLNDKYRLLPPAGYFHSGAERKCLLVVVSGVF